MKLKLLLLVLLVGLSLCQEQNLHLNDKLESHADEMAKILSNWVDMALDSAKTDVDGIFDCINERLRSALKEEPFNESKCNPDIWPLVNGEKPESEEPLTEKEEFETPELMISDILDELSESNPAEDLMKNDDIFNLLEPEFESEEELQTEEEELEFESESESESSESESEGLDLIVEMEEGLDKETELEEEIEKEAEVEKELEAEKEEGEENGRIDYLLNKHKDNIETLNMDSKEEEEEDDVIVDWGIEEAEEEIEEEEEIGEEEEEIVVPVIDPEHVVDFVDNIMEEIEEEKLLPPSPPSPPSPPIQTEGIQELILSTEQILQDVTEIVEV